MNKTIIILALFFMACTSNTQNTEATKENDHEQHDSTEIKNEAKETDDDHTLQLNNGVKWKADDATRKNVKAMVETINNNANTGLQNKEKFVLQFQSAIDLLIKECKMKDADHDALHVWLENVLHDFKELKKEKDTEYLDAFAELKADVESFYTFFE